MFSQKTQSLLIKLLLSYGEYDKELEILRQVLVEQESFVASEAFERIDKLNLNTIGVKDLIEFLSINKINYQLHEIYDLIYQYDSNLDDRLSFPDFLQMILPKTCPSLRKLSHKKGLSLAAIRKQKGILLDYSVEWALIKLIEKELFFQRQLDKQKQLLNNQPDFEPFMAFDIISNNNPEFINCDALLKFFQKNKYFLSDDDILFIFRRLDKDQDGKIIVKEFVDAIIAHGSENKNIEYNQLKNENRKILQNDQLNQSYERYKDDKIKEQILSSQRKIASPQRRTQYSNQKQKKQQLGLIHQNKSAQKQKNPKQTKQKTTKKKQKYGIQQQIQTVKKKIAFDNQNNDDYQNKILNDSLNNSYLMAHNKRKQQQENNMRENEAQDEIRYRTHYQQKVSFRDKIENLKFRQKSNSSYHQSGYESPEKEYEKYCQMQRNSSPIQISPNQKAKNTVSKHRKGKSIANISKVDYQISPFKQQSSCNYHGNVSPQKYQSVNYQNLNNNNNPQFYSDKNLEQKQFEYNLSRRNKDEVNLKILQNFEKWQSNNNLERSFEQRKIALPCTRSKDFQPNRIFIGEYEIRTLFKEMILAEREIEQIQGELAMRLDYSLNDLFQFFDMNKRGFIKQNDINFILNYLDIPHSKKDISLICKRCDNKNVGKINFQQFNNALKPKSIEQSNLIKNRITTNNFMNGNITFSSTTQHLIKNLLIKIINAEHNYKEIKKSLIQNADFNPHDAFLALDNKQKGYITLQDMKYLLEEFGIYSSHLEIKALFNRFNKMRDGKIKFNEFFNEIQNI